MVTHVGAVVVVVVAAVAVVGIAVVVVAVDVAVVVVAVDVVAASLDVPSIRDRPDDEPGHNPYTVVAATITARTINEVTT